MSFDAQVTATDDPTLLTLADGDVAIGSKLGHLASGSKRLPQPLEARVGRTRVPVARRSRSIRCSRAGPSPATRVKTTVQLRQKVKRKTSGSYRKVVLVTLSTDTP